MMLLLMALFVGQAQASDEVYFVPRLPGQAKTAQRAITDEITGAKTQVLVMAYTFTSTAVAEALIDARARGLDVVVIMDGTYNRNGPIPVLLVQNDVKVFLDYSHRVMHNKVLIVDRKTVISGSYNLSASADTRNAENIRVRRDDPCAELFLRNWDIHRAEKNTLQWKSR